MKELFISLLLLFSYKSILAQRHEITLGTRIGVPIENFQKTEAINPNHLWYKRLQSTQESGFGLNYSFKVSKKLNIHLGTGLSYVRTENTLPIMSGGDRVILLENIDIPYHRIVFNPLSLAKRFTINDLTSIELRTSLSYQRVLSSERQYSSDYKFNTTDWIEYKYDVYTYKEDEREKYPEPILNWDFSLMRQLKKGKLLLGLSLKKNIYHRYEGNIRVKYYYNGSWSNVLYSSWSGVQEKSFSYISFNVGYVFDFKRTRPANRLD